MGNQMRTMWPLWWCLEPECQKKLKKYQEDVWGYDLQIPPEPDRGNINTEIESLEEIDHLMRQAPKHQRQVR